MTAARPSDVRTAPCGGKRKELVKDAETDKGNSRRDPRTRGKIIHKEHIGHKERK